VNVVPHAPGAAGPIADEFFASNDVRCVNLIGGVKTARILAQRAGGDAQAHLPRARRLQPNAHPRRRRCRLRRPDGHLRVLLHQGQICLNTRKIIIQRGIYDEFLDKFVARTKTLPSGDPFDPKRSLGPSFTKERWT